MSFVKRPKRGHSGPRELPARVGSATPDAHLAVESRLGVCATVMCSIRFEDLTRPSMNESPAQEPTRLERLEPIDVTRGGEEFADRGRYRRVKTLLSCLWT
jgi:hypothetical protein